MDERPKVRISCGDSVLELGLERALEDHFRLLTEGETPPDCVILCVSGEEDGGLVAQAGERAGGAPIVAFAPREDLALAEQALRAGARGFVHAGMSPAQVVRAVEVVLQGELAAPRRLIEYLIEDESSPDLESLSPRQREVLTLACEGLSNAQIASRLYLSESTVKQHLRGAYKLLGVKNRTEAARLMHASGRHPPGRTHRAR
ncbi:LuxR family transcriptional regulator [Rubrobacter calidifluminis]|uniref:LuxR family transcriptional regulator n=1 Tax=Rubrobacter calidifluminis TaxID=1392640 RepID=UPI00235E5778|nr:response regulator transcription factor [Rubrobacter calidifluminis]